MVEIIHGGKFVLQNLVGYLIDGRQIRKKLSVTVQFLLCFTLYLREVSKNKPSGAYTWGGDLAEGFFCVTSFTVSFILFFFSQLAQLFEHRATVWEVTGSKSQSDQHSES